MSADARAQKRANQLFRELMDKQKDHLRVGEGRRDGTEIRLIGMAADLHGPDGICTDCHGRGGPDALA